MTEILLLEMTAGWMLIRVFLRLQLKISGSKESCLHMGTYINDFRFYGGQAKSDKIGQGG